jgi:hypothetical protein
MATVTPIEGVLKIKYYGEPVVRSDNLPQDGIQLQTNVDSDETSVLVYVRIQPFPANLAVIAAATDVRISISDPVTKKEIASKAAEAAHNSFGNYYATFEKSMCDDIIAQGGQENSGLIIQIKYQVRLVPVKFGNPAAAEVRNKEAVSTTEKKMKWMSLLTYSLFKFTDTIVISEADVSDLIKDANANKCFELLAAVRTLVSTADPNTLFAIREAAVAIGDQGMSQMAKTAIDKFLQPNAFCTLSLEGAKRILSDLDPAKAAKMGVELMDLCYKWADAEIKHQKKKKTERLMKELMRPLMQMVHFSGDQVLDSDFMEQLMTVIQNLQDLQKAGPGRPPGTKNRNQSADQSSGPKRRRNSPRDSRADSSQQESDETDTEFN